MLRELSTRHNPKRNANVSQKTSERAHYRAFHHSFTGHLKETMSDSLFGQTVWASDFNEGFVKAVVEDISQEGLSLKTAAGQIKRKYQEVFASEEDEKQLDDCCGLMYLNEATLLNNLKLRYASGKIYTYVANILISVNPYEKIDGLYSSEQIKAYRGRSLGTLPPHIYAIADKAYKEMRRAKTSQSIIVSGESGAGKTETQKAVLRYLCENWGSGAAEIQQRILETNPILESFGNAKTLRNNNSSRFGKFVEIHFAENGQVAGGFVSHYLLEKSRLCKQSGGERNYHVFYQLIAGAPKDLYEKLHLSPPETFNYLKHGSAQFFAHPDTKIQIEAGRVSTKTFARDPMVDDFQDFGRLMKAFGLAGFTEKQQSFVLQTIAGLLHLGNVEFEENPDDRKGGCQVAVASQSQLKWAAELLGLEADELKMGLVARMMQATKGGVKGTLIHVPLKAHEAAAGRDALAKCIYSKLFDWIVGAVNSRIPFKNSVAYIGVLDIAGFEFFGVNSFEQFCINYCNEKLQHFFNERILKQEQDLYAAEGLHVERIEYSDNLDCIELFEKKGTGLLDMLDEEAKLPRPTPTHYTQAVHQAYKNHFRLETPRKSKLKSHREMRDEDGFLIRHYAGTVCYHTHHFLEKNNDQLQNSLEILIEQSSVDLLRGLFESTSTDVSAKTGRKLQAASVGSKFKSQLKQLLEKLQLTGTHFVRCVKPNGEMVPWKFDGPSILSQLQCSGLPSVLQLMQKGFPSRTAFVDLYNSYHSVLPKQLTQLTPAFFCKCLFHVLGLNDRDFQFGLTKVFFRAGKFAEFDQLMRQDPETMAELVEKVKLWLLKARWRKAQYEVLSVIKLKNKILYRRAKIVLIQSSCRGFLTRRRFQKRLSLYRNCQNLLARSKQMTEIIGRLSDESQAQWSPEVSQATAELEELIKSVKGADQERVNEHLELAIKRYEQCVVRVDQVIEGLKNQIKSDELAALERNRKEQEQRERKEAEEKERMEKEKLLRRQIEEEREKAAKQYELDQAKIREQEELARKDELMRQQREERERLDAAVSTRIAATDGVALAPEPASSASGSLESSSSSKRGKHDLASWKYTDLREAINTSNDMELLVACKEEFHRRLQVYNDWKKKNASSKDVPPTRAPFSLYNNQTAKLAPATYPHVNPALRLQRYFKVPFSNKSAKNPENLRQVGGQQNGMWYAHFNGQYIQRQLTVLPGAKPQLLIAGKDDLQMCELPLDRTGLTQKKGAEVTEMDFETIWQHFGGKPMNKWTP